MDLLGSILGNMAKPPALSEQEKKRRAKEKQMEKALQEKQQHASEKLRTRCEKDMNALLKMDDKSKMELEPMPKWARAIVHDVAEVAGLVAHSFGVEDEDRHVVVWKKEAAPSEEELACLRRGDEWNPAAHAAAKEREERERRDELTQAKKRKLDEKKFVPKERHYQAKYEHLIGKDAALAGAKSTEITDRTFGMVSAESKKDRRTVEDIQAEIRAKKKKRMENDESQQEGQS